MGYSRCLDISTTVWREMCVSTIHVIAILSLFLACLQGSESTHGHGPQSTAVQQYSNLDLEGLLSRSDGPQLHGRLGREIKGSPALGKFHLGTRRRELGETTRTISGSTAQEKKESNSTRAPDMEVEALLALKAAISSDPLNALGTWNRGDYVNGSDTCSGWAGVTCPPQFPNHVILNLSQFQLVANISSVLSPLGHLPFMKKLELSFNAFSGFIQGETLTNFSRLSYLSVSHNIITGGIPSEIGELVSLQYLRIGNNKMAGQIPESLGNCSLPWTIDMRVNPLRGAILTSLGKLSSLRLLQLYGMSLSGDVPGALGNCSSLLSLGFSDNYRVGGLFPQEMSKLTQLRVLMTEFCDFFAFPSWIVNLTSLTTFSVHGNRIQGEIPANIGELEFLSLFVVAENRMTGFIPPSVHNLTALYKIHTALNNFTGPLPSKIGMLPNLQLLLTQFSYHTGTIPSSLANCSTLSSLGLGYNPMMDPESIPSWIGSFPKLLYLDLREINLQGEVPGNSIGQLSNLQQLTLGSNNLTGTILIAWENRTSLYNIDLSDNLLPGDIPSELWALGQMNRFEVNANRLIGFFPEVIAKLD